MKAKAAVRMALLGIALTGSVGVFAASSPEECEAENAECKADCNEASIEYGNCMASCSVKVDQCYDDIEREGQDYGDGYHPY